MTKRDSEDEGEYLPAIADPENFDVLQELMQREPIFHRPEFGTTRSHFEQMTDAAFWEIGASGCRYSREYVLTEVAKRYEDSHYRGMHSSTEKKWKTLDFHCLKINFLHRLRLHKLKSCLPMSLFLPSN